MDSVYMYVLLLHSNSKKSKSQQCYSWILWNNTMSSPKLMWTNHLTWSCYKVCNWLIWRFHVFQEISSTVTIEVKQDFSYFLKDWCLFWNVGLKTRCWLPLYSYLTFIFVQHEGQNQVERWSRQQQSQWDTLRGSCKCLSWFSSVTTDLANMRILLVWVLWQAEVSFLH